MIIKTAYTVIKIGSIILQLNCNNWWTQKCINNHNYNYNTKWPQKCEKSLKNRLEMTTHEKKQLKKTLKLPHKCEKIINTKKIL